MIAQARSIILAHHELEDHHFGADAVIARFQHLLDEHNLRKAA